MEKVRCLYISSVSTDCLFDKPDEKVSGQWNVTGLEHPQCGLVYRRVTGCNQFVLTNTQPDKPQINTGQQKVATGFITPEELAEKQKQQRIINRGDQGFAGKRHRIK